MAVFVVEDEEYVYFIKVQVVEEIISFKKGLVEIMFFENG